MSNIKVSRDRFFEIFADAKYTAELQKVHERTSCPYYNVIDTETNMVVGVYSDGSWENTYKVLAVYASKNDIIDHYESILKHKENKLERLNKAWKELKAYKDLSPKARAKKDKLEKEEREWRKKHPGLYSFMEDTNIVKYYPKDFNIDNIIKQLKIINDRL